MAQPRPADISSDLLEDFRLDTTEQLPRCEQLLIELERHPQDGDRTQEVEAGHPCQLSWRGHSSGASSR